MTRLILAVIVALAGISFALTAHKIVHLGISHDEFGYLPAAAHMKCQRSFDLNVEVPPLAKLWISFFLPDEVCLYTLPAKSHWRSLHEEAPVAFWSAVPPTFKTSFIERARLGQLVLYSIFVLVFIAALKTEVSWTAIVVVLGLLSSSQLFVGNLLLATTDLVFCSSLCLLFWSLRRLQRNSDALSLTFVGGSCALTILSKGPALILIGATFLLLLYSSLRNRRPRSFLTPLLIFLVTVHLFFVFDQAREFAHLDYDAILKGYEHTSLVHRLIVFLSSVLHVLPKVLAITFCFTLNIALPSAYSTQIWGQTYDQQTLLHAFYFFMGKSTFSDFAVFSILIIGCFRTRPKDISSGMGLFATYLVGFASSGIKLASRYFLPFYVLGPLSLGKRLDSVLNSRVISWIVIAGLSLQVLGLSKNTSPLSHTNFIVDLMGGREKNTSLLEDFGQETQLAFDFLKTQNVGGIFFSYSLPSRIHPARELFLAKTCDSSPFTYLTGSMNSLNSAYSQFLKFFVNDLGQLEFISELTFQKKIDCEKIRPLIDDPKTPWLQGLIDVSTDKKLFVVECQKRFLDWDIVSCSNSQSPKQYPSAAQTYLSARGSFFYFLHFRHGVEQALCFKNNSCRLILQRKN